MKSEPILKNNFEELLETLKNGSSQKFNDFIVGRLENGRVEVRGYLQYHSIHEIPKGSIKSELLKVKKDFTLLVSKSQLLKDFLLVGVDYFLDLDYGGGSVSICAEIEGVYKVFPLFFSLP